MDENIDPRANGATASCCYVGILKINAVRMKRRSFMSLYMEFLQSTFAPLVLIFTVSNLAAMGLQVNMPDVMIALKNKTSITLIFVWGWILGPAFGYLITTVLPLEEPYAIALLLASLAPCAPFLQMIVVKAHGDMGFTGAFIPLVVVGTVVLMPLMAPLLINGLSIDSWDLAKPLILTILLPLIIGAMFKHYKGGAATRIFPVVKLLAKLSTLLTIVWCLLIYGRDMLNTAGSLALLSMTIFMVGMALVTYSFGFGMKQNQRSVMALGMGTRNIAAVLAAALAIPNADSRVVVMVVMWTLWSVVLAAIGGRIFAKQYDKSMLSQQG
jgi:BASS family bile acid:Na+ symporter